MGNNSYEKKKQSSGAVIYNILWQCMIIDSFFAVFFLTAVGSSLFAGWDKSFKDVAVLGAAVSGTALLALFCVWLFLFIRLGYYKREYDIAGMGVILVVSYIIRAGMTGTIQMDEGLACYNDLKALSYHPERMLTDFVEAGKLAGRTAYGYNFFALMGEFILPGTGCGFQWVQLYMGVAAACCLYGIFKKLFPTVRKMILLPAAFVVSIQPMFLGFSTMCGLEYGIVVFFIYAFYCCLNKRYILMVFWLVMLGSTKGTGTIMALCFIGSYFLANLIVYAVKSKHARGVKEKKAGVDTKLAAAGIGTAVVIAAFVYTVWKICVINGIGLQLRHICLKLAQLYVLNFGWIWALIVIIGLVMVVFNRRVRRTYRLDFVPVFVLVMTYAAHNAYLLFYTNAVLPRYDMLSDVLLCVFGVILLIKMFERRRAVLSVLGIVGVMMFGEAFVTIDPISSSVFTNIETNSFPMVQTAAFKSEQEKAENNAGDFGYYNYQYTFIDKAIDNILWRFNWYGDCKVVSAYDGCEVQFYYDDLMWDMDNAKRAYPVGGGSEDRYQYIGRVNYRTLLEGEGIPNRAVFIDSPWCTGDTQAAIDALAEIYNVDGPMESEQGFAGSVTYYFLEKK